MNRGASPRSVAVLVIDDDDDIRATLAEVLQEVGYSVASASHGVEALELLRDLRPSVILLDLNMPVMGGAEFRELQRKDALLCTIPTIVMTAVDRMPDSFEELEAEQILAKPFRLPDLLALLELYLGPATPQA